MTAYAVTATVSRTVDGWAQHRSLPTFFLDSNVQGITNREHAGKIAREIVDPFGELGVFIYATEVPESPNTAVEVAEARLLAADFDTLGPAAKRTVQLIEDERRNRG